MADSTISNLPASTGVDPTNDVLPIVHTSTTQKVSPQDIVDAAFPQVPFTPTGSISATTVAGAINELDAEKAPLSSLPTAMDSATAQAGTSTTPQTVSASVLKAGVDANANVVKTYATVGAIPAGFVGTARVGTDLYAGDGTSVVGVGAGTTVNLALSNTGAVNSALIQAALDLAGDVYVEGSGVYPINNTLIIGSNTNLYVSNLITLKAGLATTGSLLKNKSMTLTSVTCSISYVVNDTIGVDSAFATVTLASHGYVKGDFVYLSGATDPVFRGCFLITSITSSSIFVVNLQRVHQSMTTGVVAGTTKAIKADSNFNVTGGKWDYSWTASPFNQDLSMGINDICIWAVGAARFSIKNITGIDTKKFLVGIQGCTNFSASYLGGIVSSDAVKIYGPSYGGEVCNINAQSTGDDVVTLQNAESPSYNYTMPYLDGGDVINMNIANIGGKSLQRGVGIFSYRPTDGMIDLVNFTNTSIQSSGGVTAIDGFIGYTGNLGAITYTNVSGNHKAWPLFIVSGGGAGSGPMSIKNLVVNNPILYGKANVSRMFQITGGLASNIVATVNGGYIEYADNVLNLGIGQGIATYTFDGLHVNSGWSTFKLDSNCKIKYTNGFIEGTIAQNLILCGTALTTTEFTLENLNITATIANLAIVQNGAALKLTMKNVKFTAAPSVFLWNTGGTSTVDIYAENVNLAGVPVIQNDAGAVTTVNSWGEGLVIDVQNLSLTKGQKAWHSSSAAGRNAAAQQGPAFCNGTSWYALGTGALGVNTLIRS